MSEAGEHSRPVGRRRWLRFSLRSFLLVVTLLGAWLGYQVNWVRARRAFIAEECAIRDAQKGAKRGWWSTIDNPGQTPPRAPWGLWVFGEQGYTSIAFISQSNTPVSQRALTDRDRERLETAKRLFPEANINVIAVWETEDEHGVGHWRAYSR
jgi:hypothetical protein